MVENVEMRQIIAKIDFSRIFQLKENFYENLTPSCHGNAFIWVTSKSTNLAKSLSWFPWKPDHMTIPIKNDKHKSNLHATSYKKQLYNILI